jgi:hypothetical protein
MTRHRLKVGDWVEIRSKEEILRTLDADGRLDGMPFMPEMFQMCGTKFQVYKRAHKTCDTVFPVRGRRVSRAVHLETRCDGSAHGGCQAGCLLFWKEAWLKPANKQNDAPALSMPSVACTEQDVRARTQVSAKDGEPRYVCQATQLPYATTTLKWWDVRQYVEDYWSGNVTFWQVFSGLVYSIYYNVSETRIGIGPLMRWFYDQFHSLWRGTAFPQHKGTIPVGEATPTADLNLQSGELVRVKSHREILRTLTTDGRNRGMRWDAELVPYCGGTYRVLRRVHRIIDEKTGKMLEMKSPCIVLDSVFCRSRYSACRMFCPRSIFSYWREIWLERVSACDDAAMPPQQTPVRVPSSKV